MARRRRRKKRYLPSIANMFDMDPETKRDVGAIFLFVLSVVFLLSIFDVAGSLGVVVVTGLKWILGSVYLVVPFIFIVLGYMIISRNRIDVSAINYIGLFFLVLSFSGLVHLRVPIETVLEDKFAGVGGGVIGFVASYPLMRVAGFWVTLVVLLGVLFISLLLLFNATLAEVAEKGSGIAQFFSYLSPRKLFGFASSRRLSYDGDYEEDEDYEEEDDDAEWAEDFEEREISKVDGVSREKDHDQEVDLRNTEPAPRRNHPKIDLPVDLLKGKAGLPTSGDIENNQQIIERTLANFGIDVEMRGVSVGPTVTQYTLRPSEGVKLNRITSLANDLALALAAHPIRIEAPIPGKSLVGIEVPNQKVALVPLKDIISSKEFKKASSCLGISLGKDVSGKPWVTDLSTLPHLLIAGATGSGKSVMVNSLIVSLLYQNQANDLKFIMVDPKRVELTGYDGIPHLLTPVITEVDKTINSLRWLTSEMERRFELLSRSRKRNIQAYNAIASKDSLPYIVVIIDELADLMSVAAAEMEAVIVRLAQMARAVGIHLVLATQRPSVDVITGLIKANITARIAFSVASLVDSRTILDMAGAEKLLGRGDLLFMSASISKPKRLQGAFLSDSEIESVVDYLKSKDSPDYLDAVTKPSGGKGMIGGGSDQGDDKFESARDLVVESGKASASFLQRRLRVGYARAARLMDLLESTGIVGPADGAKPREILVTPSELETFSSSEVIDDAEVINENEYDGEDEEVEDEEGGFDEDHDERDEEEGDEDVEYEEEEEEDKSEILETGHYLEEDEDEEVEDEDSHYLEDDDGYEEEEVDEDEEVR